MYLLHKSSKLIFTRVHFSCKDTGSEAHEVTCPSSHNREMVKPSVKTHSPNSETIVEARETFKIYCDQRGIYSSEREKMW
jgi:hypothetical protein